MAFGARVAAIELAGDDVRLAVIKSGGKLPAVLELISTRAAYETPEERNDALVRAVDEALGQIKSRPVACVLCASSLFTIVRQLSIPFRGQRRVGAAVPFELEPYLAFPLEDLMLDYNVVAEADGGTEVLAIGMRRSYLEEQKGLLEQCGVEVEAVNIDAVGLTGLWQAQRRQYKGLNAVLHVRGDGASLAITYNKTVAYLRPLSITAVQLFEQPGAAAREIQNTLRAFLANWRGEGEIASLHITGVRLHPEDKAAFSEALRLPVEDGVMLEGLKGAASAVERTGEDPGPNYWEAAVGVAASAAGVGPSLDFGRSSRDWRSSVRGLVTHVMFSACLTLLVLIGVALYYQQAATAFEFQSLQIQQEVDALITEVEQLAEEGLGDDINVDHFLDPPALNVLREISARMPGDKVTITKLEIQPVGMRRAWITITGEAASAAAVNEVYEDLRGSTLFRAAESPTINVVGNNTNFIIRLDRPGEELDNEAA